MKYSLLNILVCPACKGKLEIEVEAEKDGEITTGSLICAKCNINYPIKDGIPTLMVPEKGDG